MLYAILYTEEVWCSSGTSSLVALSLHNQAEATPGMISV